jgi:hypothetical protein
MAPDSVVMKCPINDSVVMKCPINVVDRLFELVMIERERERERENINLFEFTTSFLCNHRTV